MDRKYKKVYLNKIRMGGRLFLGLLVKVIDKEKV